MKHGPTVAFIIGSLIALLIAYFVGIPSCSNLELRLRSRLELRSTGDWHKSVQADIALEPLHRAHGATSCLDHLHVAGRPEELHREVMPHVVEAEIGWKLGALLVQ